MKDTLSITINLTFDGPVTEAEKNTILGNIWEHIGYEYHAEIEGFVKVESCEMTPMPAKSPRRIKLEREFYGIRAI